MLLFLLLCCFPLCQYLSGWGQTEDFVPANLEMSEGIPGELLSSCCFQHNIKTRHMKQNIKEASKVILGKLTFFGGTTVKHKRIVLNLETSGYVGAGSPDLDLAIAVEMSQVRVGGYIWQVIATYHYYINCYI